MITEPTNSSRIIPLCVFIYNFGFFKNNIAAGKQKNFKFRLLPETFIFFTLDSACFEFQKVKMFFSLKNILSDFGSHSTSYSMDTEVISLA